MPSRRHLNHAWVHPEMADVDALENHRWSFLNDSSWRLNYDFVNPVKPRLHDTTCCQCGCQTGLTTGCIVYTQRSTGCQTRLTTGLTTGCIVYTAGCQTGCTTRFDNRLNEQWLFVQHGCQTGCQTGLTTGLATAEDVCLHDTAATGLTTGCIV